MGFRNGVEVREKSIRLFFVHNGERCRETLTVAGKPAAEATTGVGDDGTGSTPPGTSGTKQEG